MQLSPYFDRMDICYAYLVIEWDWNVGGILQERASNKRRNMSTDFQLKRIGFNPGRNFNGFRDLSENAKEIYYNLCLRYGFEFPYDVWFNEQEER